MTTISFFWYGSITSATHDGERWSHPEPGLEALLNTIPGDPESVAQRLAGSVVKSADKPEETDE